MTAAPNSTLVARVAAEIEKLGVSASDSTDFAEVAIAAGHVNEMIALLRHVAGYQDANPISDAHYVVRKQARALLDKLGD